MRLRAALVHRITSRYRKRYDKTASVRRIFLSGGAYARDVKSPSCVCRRELGGCGPRDGTHGVNWIRASSAVILVAVVDSRYANARV